MQPKKVKMQPKKNNVHKDYFAPHKTCCGPAIK